MLDVLDKRIISTSVSDARFLPGETLGEIFARTELAYGDGLKLYFANDEDTTEEGARGRILEVNVVVPPDGAPILSMRLGDWVVRGGEMHVDG